MMYEPHYVNHISAIISNYGGIIKFKRGRLDKVNKYSNMSTTDLFTSLYTEYNNKTM